MRILVLSDLHLEHSPWAPDLDTVAAADVVVLAGDIHQGVRGLEWARAQFLDRPVIYVSGNHEYYGGLLQGVAVEMRKVARELGIHYLDNDQLVLDGVRFLGATLWTDFLLFGATRLGDALHAAGNGITDFHTIRFGSTGWFRPGQSVLLHRVSRDFLAQRLATPFNGKTVVVTHHVPTNCAIAPKYSRDILSAAFASNLDHLVERADLWVAGHTHIAADVSVGECRVVVNPRGYPGEASGWNPRLLVEVEGS
jgi:predicted phosphodiesterase